VASGSEGTIERIVADGELIAIIVPQAFSPDKTTFITSDDLAQQLGFVVYSAGGEIVPHQHTDVERTTVGTLETLVVRSGRMEVDLYDKSRKLVATRSLGPGDVLALISGGHGFRMREDTVLLEIKQGPYGGEQDKVRFEP
jgi:mannose-6-phosphate isomerase-like protein (cupin superfamily)